MLNDELALICPDPVIGIRRNGIITLFNPAAERMLGYSRDEVIGQLQVAKLYPSRESAREIKRLMYSDSKGIRGQIIGHNTHLLSKSGERIPIQLSASLVEQDGREVGSIGFFRDLTERLELERSLKLLTVTDNLTGLYNQRHFQTVLKREIGRSNRYKHPLSLICIDLDNFKSVNDSLGHIEGDLALRYVGDCIATLLRNSDYGFRYGGDEFMLLLPETPQQQAQNLTMRLIDHFSRHMPANLVQISREGKPVSLSIGIAQYREDESVSTFIKRTDLAMYQAKKSPGCLAVMAD
ncbi:GGDEF domain-containing protein [Sedimenticola thiotaurini]|uniref:GGDEF domain-containing protein n=1 Tax=Sedimenticola thiotaurini TaxID=1543721 RepID=UPI0019013C73|nr:sensor domain-containing diguanylate cyclase [Sedimenticola thiotaurini]